MNRDCVKKVIALAIGCFVSTIIILCNNTVFAWLLVCFIMIFIFFACNYKNNIVIMAFMVCFFVFLMGKPLMMEVFDYSKYSAISLSQDTRNQIYALLMLSLVSITVGYLMMRFKDKKLDNCTVKIDKFEKNKNESIRKVSKYATIILYLLVVLENILRFVFIRQVGYTASFSMDNGFMLPFGLHNLVLIAPVAIAIFFATLPSRREIILPVVLFLTANIISSMAGNRFEIVSCVLALIVYGVWRNSLDNYIWIKGKHFLILVLIAPIVIVLLQNIMYWRDGRDLNNDSEPIAEFLYGTGGSSDLIGAVEQYGDKVLKDDVLYSFGGIWRGLNSNIVAQAFGLGARYESQTVDYANNAHSLGSALTYYFYPQKYLSGYGLGGCYIAELYHDFSTFGVIIGNLLIGITIGFISRMKRGKIIHNFFCFFLIVLLLRLPRDSFDYPITSILNLKNIVLVVVILLLSNRLRKITRPFNESDTYEDKASLSGAVKE